MNIDVNRMFLDHRNPFSNWPLSATLSPPFFPWPALLTPLTTARRVLRRWCMSVLYLHADGRRPFFFPFYKFTASTFIYIKMFHPAIVKNTCKYKNNYRECCVDLNLNCTVNISEKWKAKTVAEELFKIWIQSSLNLFKEIKSLIFKTTKSSYLHLHQLEMSSATHYVYIYTFIKANWFFDCLL